MVKQFLFELNIMECMSSEIVLVYFDRSQAQSYAKWISEP